MATVVRLLLRRAVYGLAVLLGVNLLTFVLFFTLATPDDMARMNIGGKHVTALQIDDWKQARGYDKPLYWNGAAAGWRRCTDTVFWQRSVSLLALDFGHADSNSAVDICHDVAQRIGVSLQLALPLLAVQLAAGIGLGLLLVLLRGTGVDFWGAVACVLLLSVSGLFYILIGQMVFSRWLHLAPVSGYAPGVDTTRFLALPLGMALLARLGSDGRLYRALLLEEFGRDHVRAARAQGLGEWQLLWRHVLPNAYAPILTIVGGDLPYVILGSLVFESFFGIPGLGAYVVDAIAGQDFAIVRTMVFVGAMVHVVAFLLIDVGQVLVDPRRRDQRALPGVQW